MKIVYRAVVVTALTLGIGALIHPISASATPVCTECPGNFAAECQQGNQAACKQETFCEDFCPGHGATTGTPPAKLDEGQDVAMSNSTRTMTVAK